MKIRSDYPYRLFSNKLFAMACLSAVLGLAACQPEGQAEKAGKKVDKAVENAGQKIEQSAEKAGQKIEAAKESVAQQAGKAEASIDKAAETSNDSLEKAGKQIDQAINHSEHRLEAAKDAVVDSTKATGEYLDDSVITAKVKTALLNDDFLKLAPIDVTTVNGVVTLRGTVDSEQLVGRALGLVNGQEHVKSVQNELLVKTSVPSKQ
ncbi:BON domain-containing protein [Methylomonas fluvii]|uniref:BON domain-containing protein n=1 Tax=Methylomonas fluvii TaxID=1854564 RepID=A0ABR9DGZ6_9GAMM|nr:BON domain-containing protein [Methylomonas fluvii]MBD9362371.1 BON domain-containing protein [Methylomonas fluvii]